MDSKRSVASGIFPQRPRSVGDVNLFIK